MTETVRVDLRKFDGVAATYRTSGEDDPIHQFVVVTIDRDRFITLGKPGHLDATITIAEAAP
jgi:hypothetical protein